MTDLMHRVELHNPDQARPVLTQSLLPWIGEQLKVGRGIVIEARLLEDEKSDRQRRYLHGVVLTEIAQQARANGQQFAMPVWKEFFRTKFLGYKRVLYINPITGRKSRRSKRISTEDLGLRAYSEYIERVTAFAVTELGVEFSEPMPEDLRPIRKARERTDMETGEITEVTA